MSDLSDFHAYKSTSSGSGLNAGRGGGGKRLGCGGRAVIGLAAMLLICFIADDASWDAIDSLLGSGLLAVLFFRWLFS